MESKLCRSGRQLQESCWVVCAVSTPLPKGSLKNTQSEHRISRLFCVGVNVSALCMKTQIGAQSHSFHFRSTVFC